MNLPEAYSWGEPLPTLTSSRVVLRPVTHSDVAAYFAIFSDPETMRYWSRPPMQQMAEAESYVERVLDAVTQRRVVQWAIALPGANTAIGHIALHKIDLDHRRAEVGFALSRTHWGGGLMSQALAMLIAFAFESMQLHRLEADVDPRNASSLKLLSRHGFVTEGHLRERFLVSGEWCDSVMLGLLRSAWDPSGGA